MSKSIAHFVFSPRNAANLLIRYALLPLETYAVITQIDTVLPKKSFSQVLVSSYLDSTLFIIILVQALLNNILDYINSRKVSLIGEKPNKFVSILFEVAVVLFSIGTFYPVKNYLRWNQIDVSIGCYPLGSSCIDHERQFTALGFFEFPISELFRGLLLILFLYALMDAVKGALTNKLKKMLVRNEQNMSEFDKAIVDYFIPCLLSTVFYPMDAVQKRTRVHGSTLWGEPIYHSMNGFINIGLPFLLAEMVIGKYAQNKLAGVL